MLEINSNSTEEVAGIVRKVNSILELIIDMQLVLNDLGLVCTCFINYEKVDHFMWQSS